VSSVEISLDDVSSIDNDSKFITLGFSTEGSFGKLRVYSLETMNEVHSISGSESNKNLGFKVRIHEE